MDPRLRESRLLAAVGEFTQPRAHSFAQPCIINIIDFLLLLPQLTRVRPSRTIDRRNSMECEDQAMMSDHERRSNGSGISASNNANHATNNAASDHDVNNKVGSASEKTATKIPSWR